MFYASHTEKKKNYNKCMQQQVVRKCESDKRGLHVIIPNGNSSCGRILLCLTKIWAGRAYVLCHTNGAISFIQETVSNRFSPNMWTLNRKLFLYLMKTLSKGKLHFVLVSCSTWQMAGQDKDLVSSVLKKSMLSLILRNWGTSAYEVTPPARIRESGSFNFSTFFFFSSDLTT